MRVSMRALYACTARDAGWRAAGPTLSVMLHLAGCGSAHTHPRMHGAPTHQRLVHGRFRMIDALRRGRVSSRAPAKVSTAPGTSGLPLPAISYLTLGKRVTAIVAVLVLAGCFAGGDAP